MADPNDNNEDQDDDYNHFYDPNSDDAWERYLASKEREQNMQAERDREMLENVGEFFEEVGDAIGDAADAVGDAISDAWDSLFGDDEEKKEEEQDASN